MDYTSPSSYDESRCSSTYVLGDRLTKLSMESEPNNYGYEAEVIEDEVLYVTQQDIVNDEDCTYESSYAEATDWEEQGSGSADIGAVDRIITELAPEEVRWMYKANNDKQWVPFSGYDSVRIEERFRQLAQVHVWPDKEYPTERVEDSLASLGTDVPDRMDDSIYYDASSSVASKTTPSNDTFQSIPQLQEHLVVRGGMYEVDLENFKCASIFWPGEQCPITRGTWFYDGSWQPLERERSDMVDQVHLKLFKGHLLSHYASIDNSKLPKSVIYSETFSDFRVDWYSPLEVYSYSEATPSKMVRTITQKLGYFQKTAGYRLCRGYKSDAKLDDRPVDITHLVFVIHGIGQKFDKDRIIRNTSTFRECVEWLQTKYFPQYSYRAEFFPVGWRSALKLDGGIVEAITPNKVQSIRQRLNATAMDIMYYTSPLYSQEIQHGLAQELNRLYSTFTQRNPGFATRGGKVSIIAHSLGCVIVYDIITGWSITHTLEQRKAQESNPSQNGVSGHSSDSQRSSAHSTPVHRPALLFELDNIFCLGSPLAVFLALRVQDPQAESCHRDLLPSTLCKRFFNIFHPSDPVAYRMEPLLLRHFARVAPLQIQAYNAALHPLYTDQPLEPLVPDAVTTSSKQAADDSDSPKSPGGTPSRERGWSLWNIVRGARKVQDDTGSPQVDSPSQDLEYRIDYVLRESKMYGAPYIAAITSHTDYWGNYDVAYFALTRLFPELEVAAAATATPIADPSAAPQSPPQQSPQQSMPRIASPPQMLQQVLQMWPQMQSSLQSQQSQAQPLPQPQQQSQQQQQSQPQQNSTLLQVQQAIRRKGSAEVASR